MQSRVVFDEFQIRTVETEREVNFEVLDEEGYVCRLVPGLFGFSLSPLDFALGNTRALPLVARFSELILHRDA